MFRALILSAAAAGVIGGVITAGYQFAVVTPLILEAEIFEHGGPSHAPPHYFDLLRYSLTVAATTVTAAGWALILLGLLVIEGGRIGWRRALGWGTAGFVAVALAPAVGLPPELPGMPAAEVGARQVWWLLTVAATGFGLWAILRRGSPLFVLAGVAAIIVPHIVGAPQAPSHASDVPAALAGHFVAASLAGSLLMWTLTSASAGAVFARLGGAGDE
jgi:cobalt transporter subunit CbtA